jgi:hypothetical protein
MVATGPRGVDAYFPETDKNESPNSPAQNHSSAPEEPGGEESFKTTVYITAEQRDYIDGLRYNLRKKMPGLTRSAVIRLALDTLAELDQEQVAINLLRHPEGTPAQ